MLLNLLKWALVIITAWIVLFVLLPLFGIHPPLEHEAMKINRGVGKLPMKIAERMEHLAEKFKR